MKDRNRPRVSIVIPTYNRANLLDRSIRSVLNQTYQEFELIVVDDASTDNTSDVITKFHDERIKFIRHDKNRGAGAARNTGIKAARYGYLAFHDSDDEWLPYKLEKQMRLFETLPLTVGVVYADMWKVEEGKRTHLSSPHVMPKHKITSRPSLRYRLFGIGIQSTVVRKECLTAAGLFDESLPALEDSEFLIRVSAHYDLYHIHEPLVNYYQTPDGLMHSAAKVATAWQLILDKHREEILRDRRTLAWYRVNTSFWLSLSGNPLAAGSLLRDAVAADLMETRVSYFRLARTVPFIREHMWRNLYRASRHALRQKLANLRNRIVRRIRRVWPRRSS